MMSVNATPDVSAGANYQNNVSYVVSPTTAIQVAHVFSSNTIELAFSRLEDFIMINRQKHYTNIYMIG